MNISKVKNCFGCGVCASVCPKKIIMIESNKKGFYEPVITDVNKCSNCGICNDVCSFCHDSISLEKKDIKAWAAWSNDEAVRRKRSSGGIGFEIAKLLIDRGYKVVACRYDTVQQRAQPQRRVWHHIRSANSKLSKEERDVILAALLRRHAGVRQLQRLTGIGKNIISNVSKKYISRQDNVLSPCPPTRQEGHPLSA